MYNIKLSPYHGIFNILNQYKSDQAIFIVRDIEKKQPVLLSTLLMQVLSEKSSQFKGQPVNFEYDLGNNKNYYTFINVEPTSLKRSLSNLINNAVDALKKQPGTVILYLNCKSTEVHIIASIESTIGKATKMILTFVKCEAPNWIANKVHLNKNDTVIVLDDDSFIHGAWDARFKPILKQTPNLQVKHYTNSIDAINYINSLSTDEKQSVFLLTDYEFLKQNINGLGIIEHLQLKRMLLVTSHHDNHKVRIQAISLGIKILPKILAAEISIEFTKSSDDAVIMTPVKEYVLHFQV
jgi:hypothetical protein